MIEAPDRRSDRRGFALVMVVFLLFAVALAGATGYQIASSEHELATGGEASEEALAVAKAGIERYVGEHLGLPAGSTVYPIDSGSVTITARKVARVDSATDMYMLQAVGTIPDARYPSSPAKRTVRQYAKLHLMPVRPYATLMTTAQTLTIASAGTVRGANDNDLTDCNSGTGGWVPGHLFDIIGAAGRATFTKSGAGTLSGGVTPLTSPTKSLPSGQAVIDTAGMNWSVLENSQFSVGSLDGSSLPSQATLDALPSDSFPIVRVNGDLSLPSGTRSGQGVLIVTEDLSQGFLSDFEWHGIILVGKTATLGGSFRAFALYGMIVTGLDGAAMATQAIGSSVNIENCVYYIKKADSSLAYLELIDGSRWEF